MMKYLGFKTLLTKGEIKELKSLYALRVSSILNEQGICELCEIHQDSLPTRGSADESGW